MKHSKQLLFTISLVAILTLGGCSFKKGELKINENTKLEKLRKRVAEGNLTFYSFTTEKRHFDFYYDGEENVDVVTLYSDILYQYDLANKLYYVSYNVRHSPLDVIDDRAVKYEQYVTIKKGKCFSIIGHGENGKFEPVPFLEYSDEVHSQVFDNDEEMPKKEDFKDDSSLRYPSVMTFLDQMLAEDEKGNISLNRWYFTEKFTSKSLTFSQNSLKVEYIKEYDDEESEINGNGVRELRSVGSTKITLPDSASKMIDEYLASIK